MILEYLNAKKIQQIPKIIILINYTLLKKKWEWCKRQCKQRVYTAILNTQYKH